MPKFSKVSAERLESCDHRLQSILIEVIDSYDFAVVDGYRDEFTQNKYYETGRSRLKFPNSKHNIYPSKAVDVCPYVEGVGLVWDDNWMWNELAIRILQEGHRQGTRLRWGGTWKTFIDKPHFELL